MGNSACCTHQSVSSQFHFDKNTYVDKIYENPEVPKLNPYIEETLFMHKPFHDQFEQLTDIVTNSAIGGDIYQGQINQQKHPHGLGKMYKNNGAFYIGHFCHGEAHGLGFYIMVDGSFYSGEFVKNYAESKNGFFKNKEFQYRGGFQKNSFNGEGKQISENYQFEGKFQHGKRVSGHLKWGIAPNNYEYKGKFDKNDRFEGKGNGCFDVGELKGPNGVYEGNFVNGVKQGKGMFLFKSQIRYEGSYKNDLKNGQGIIFNYDNTVAYSGEFIDGLPHGKGFATDQNGNAHDLNWVQGVYQRQQ